MRCSGRVARAFLQNMGFAHESPPSQHEMSLATILHESVCLSFSLLYWLFRRYYPCSPPLCARVHACEEDLLRRKGHRLNIPAQGVKGWGACFGIRCEQLIVSTATCPTEFTGASEPRPLVIPTPCVVCRVSNSLQGSSGIRRQSQMRG